MPLEPVMFASTVVAVGVAVLSITALPADPLPSALPAVSVYWTVAGPALVVRVSVGTLELLLQDALTLAGGATGADSLLMRLEALARRVLVCGRRAVPAFRANVNPTLRALSGGALES